MTNLRLQLSFLFSLLCSCFTYAQQWSGPPNTTDVIYRQGLVTINGGIRGGVPTTNDEFPISAAYTKWDGSTISMYTTNHSLNPGGMEFNNHSGWFSFNCKSGGDWIEALRINSNRTVGIGTSVVPNGYLLAVRNGIISEKVRVEFCSAGGWCDYVFGKDYPLLPLQDLQTFIDKNHHLPGMPSGTSIESDGGFELKDMTIRQQEKIEELFLYVLQLKDEINQLKLQLSTK